MVLAEEGNQHLRPGRADDRMSARVGGVRGGIADLGKPIRVSLGFRVTIRSGSTDRGHWSPQIVRVFGDPGSRRSPLLSLPASLPPYFTQIPRIPGDSKAKIALFSRQEFVPESCRITSRV